MKRHTARSQQGFTLVEVVVATGLGLVVAGAAVSLFQSASTASQLTFSRSDMQQTARGAIAIITRDLSQAAIGIPQTGISLPSGSNSVTALAACGPSQCYLANGAYPNNLLAPVVPGDLQGANNTDSITITYLDSTWPVTNKALTALAQDGSSITVDTTTYDSNGNAAAAPAGRAYDDAVFGTKVGDVIMIYNTNGYAIATVTGVGKNGLVSLAAGDPIKLNQPTAAAGNVAALRNAPNPPPNGPQVYPSTSAARLNVVTYFIQNNAGPDGILGTADDFPVLMRQVNAQNAIPLSDYISNMNISYDTYDSVNSVYKAGLDGAAVSNSSDIRKITIALTLQSSGTGTARNETYTISTAVSPRDLSFQDRYK